MSTNTPNYNLKKPASTDFYNIADFNGNADIIDAQLKSINDQYTDLSSAVETNTVKVDAALAMGVRTLSCTKSGNTFKLTQPLPSTGMYSCIFTAPADYMTGDSFTVNGTIYAVSTSDGEELGDKAFVSGAVVPVVLDQAGKTINFKQAERKLTLSAESYVMVKCITANELFAVPMTGKYRVTCIGKGGDGDDAHYRPGSYALNGSGGGAGGAVSAIFELEKRSSYVVTVNDAVSSFGNFLTATAGQKGVFNENQGGTSAVIAGGAAGTASSNGNSPAVYAGQPGDVGEAVNLGVPGSSGQWKDSSGGNGGGYTANQSKFLPTTGGLGGSHQVDSVTYYPLSKIDGSSPDVFSPSGFYPFGAGGGGGAYHNGGIYLGGHGGKGAVIIELILD